MPPPGALAQIHGDPESDHVNEFLVYETIPRIGAGLLSGQWGTYKTFVGMDLGAAVITGTPIFDREVDAPGAVLFYTAEGEGEVSIRIDAALANRGHPAGKPAPFAWLTPMNVGLTLLDPGSVARFIARVKEISAEMIKRFEVPLRLIEIDTLIATAGFRKRGDANDDVSDARVMQALREISRNTGAFVVAFDHFGKAVETGTRAPWRKRTIRTPSW